MIQDELYIVSILHFVIDLMLISESLEVRFERQLVLNGSGQLVDNVTHYGSPCMVHANGPKKGSIAALAQELEGLQR